MNNRLKKLREILNLSQNEFSEKISIARSTLSLLEKGERILQDRHIKLICQTFNVNEDWLRNGNEPIFIEKDEDILNEFIKQYGLSEFMSTIIRRYLNLEPEYQKMFEDFIKEFVKDIQPEKSKNIVGIFNETNNSEMTNLAHPAEKGVVGITAEQLMEEYKKNPEKFDNIRKKEAL